MRRIRSIALPIALTVLTTGCYTQLRAPRSTSYYPPTQASGPSYDHRPHWHAPVPVFHLPRYDHHDWWLYGDAHCTVWVNRYLEYHPWLPRHHTHIIIGRPYKRRRHHRYFWHRPVKVYPRWRHHGPRFEPLSPTIDVEVEIVENRGRFRRAGFAGGVPERADDLVVTRSWARTRDTDDGVTTQTVTIQRPTKVRRGLAHKVVKKHTTTRVSASVDPGDDRARGWDRSTRKPDRWKTAKTDPGKWEDTGRDVKGHGPKSNVREQPAKQPKPQSTWIYPENRTEEKQSVSERPGRRERRDQSTNWGAPGKSASVDKDRREAKPSSGRRGTVTREPETRTRSWRPEKKVERPTETKRYSKPRKPETPKKVTRRSQESDNPKRQENAEKKEEKKEEEKKNREKKRRDTRRRRGM